MMKTYTLYGVTIELEIGGEAEAEFLEECWWYEEEPDAELVAWLHSPEAKESPEYSDIYKDVYGVRPRW